MPARRSPPPSTDLSPTTSRRLTVHGAWQSGQAAVAQLFGDVA
jgi:hypothetical protein